MGYLDEDNELEESEFEEEDEIRELEVDNNGRIRRGPVVNPDPDYFEDEEGAEEYHDTYGNTEDEDL